MLPPPPSGPSSYAEYVVQQSDAPGAAEPLPASPRPSPAPEPDGPPEGGVPGGGGPGAVPPLPVLKPGAKSSGIVVSPRQVRGVGAGEGWGDHPPVSGGPRGPSPGVSGHGGGGIPRCHGA